jgi:LEA14-like dessication related protein
MLNIRRIAALLLTCVAATLAGCAAVTMKSPEVSLSGVTIDEFGLLEQRLGIKLRVMNPNDADLPIDGVTFDVDVNGQSFAKGVSNKPVTVPRFGEAVLNLSAVSTLGSLLRQLADLAKSGHETVEYRVYGRFYGGGLNGVPFDSKREIKIPKHPLFPAPQPSPPAGSL